MIYFVIADKLSRQTIFCAQLHAVIKVSELAPVPALHQLRPPRKLHVRPPLSASKVEVEGKGGFTQNAIFIRICISCIFVRFLMNESNEYVFTQNAIAYDFASAYLSLKPTHVF